MLESSETDHQTSSAMAKGKDYYKILGVEKGAGDAELKKGKNSDVSLPLEARPAVLTI